MRLQATPPQTGAPPSTRVLWPDAVAFREAVQNPRSVLGDPALQGADVVLDRCGLPLAYTGRFAVVFRLRTGQGDWALRCFTQSADQEERGERYTAIAEHLRDRGAPFVPFRYLGKGVRVGSDWYPAVAMRWAEGETLGRFVEEHHDDPFALAHLCGALTGLITLLEREGVAHGDWQHDNLLVSSRGREITLVDYDGLYVPALAGRASPELGHPNYQHPARTGRDYAVGLDRFSHLAIQTALLALRQDPSLWARFNDGESLLFRKADFADPAVSPVFRGVRPLAGRDPLLGACLRRLESACAAGRQGVVLAADAAAPVPPAYHGAPPGWWVSAQARVSSAPASRAAGSAAGRSAPDAARLEAQHGWVMRVCSGLPAAAAAYTAWAAADAGYLLGGALFNLALFSYGYRTWPRKKIRDGLLRSIHEASEAILNDGRRLRELRAACDSLASLCAAGNVDEFVERELKKVPLARSFLLGAIGHDTILRLSAEGVSTAADLQNRWAPPGVSPHQYAALQNWARRLRKKAAREFDQFASRRRWAEAEIARWEQGKEAHRKRWEELQRQKTFCPDASPALFLRSLFGLG